jgi:hypothetical protein
VCRSWKIICGLDSEIVIGGSASHHSLQVNFNICTLTHNTLSRSSTTRTTTTTTTTNTTMTQWTNSKPFFYILFINVFLSFPTVRIHNLYSTSTSTRWTVPTSYKRWTTPSRHLRERMGERRGYVFFDYLSFFTILMSILRINYTYGWRRQERQGGRWRYLSQLAALGIFFFSFFFVFAKYLFRNKTTDDGQSPHTISGNTRKIGI